MTYGTEWPGGLEFEVNDESVILSGIPSKAGRFEFKLKAELDGMKSDERSYVLNVYPRALSEGPEVTGGRLEILTGSDLGRVNPGVRFIKLIEANTSGVSWDIDGQPKGLTISQTGRINGIISEEGIFSFTITASKSGWYTASKNFTLTVIPSEAPQNQTSRKSNGCNSGTGIMCSGVMIFLNVRRRRYKQHHSRS